MPIETPVNVLDVSSRREVIPSGLLARRPVLVLDKEEQADLSI